MEESNYRKTVIGSKFFDMVKNIYQYIKRDSPQSAELFINGILPTIEKVEKNPRLFPLVKIDGLSNNKVEYRYYHYFKRFKIVYKLIPNLLIFLGIIHDSQSEEAVEQLKKKEYE